MNRKTLTLICAVVWPMGLTLGQDVLHPVSATVASASESVCKVIGMIGDFSVSDRVRMLHSLGTNLPQEDVTALIGYLAAPMPPEANLDSLRWLKNDVMCQLRIQNPPPPNLPRTLAAIYQDEKQDPVIRDYALQHLAECRWDQAALDLAKKTLWEAVTETNSSLAGTALLGLSRICQAEGGSLDRLRSTALAVATNTKFSEVSRLTALSLCGQLGEQRALPLAVALTGSEQSVALRIAAIGVLGKLGGKSELATLAHLESAGEPMLLPAVKQACKNLATRTGIKAN